VDNNKKILILNTGGTFNKLYDQIKGSLVVSKNNDAIKTILNHSKIDDISIDGILYKDSLDINDNDREVLVTYIKRLNYQKIIIVHGTDTMDITAEYIFNKIKDKTIILTGAMIPFSIDPIEATSNLSLAIGNIKLNNKNNIYIAMHGKVKKYNKIKKNRVLGVFQ
jgi:L-asparaginase